ncbi:CRISPR-associated endonuclease Cas2 [Testudinibacter sp. P80/BLE/0925]|uniref:CRISPR-associated endonuclease Cas2 n=1 Tax=Testudinibacter sp. TW-1 TaxID=3417757 RepID=UPI003D35A600
MDSTRSFYLIAYDITESKRLRCVHKKIESYAVSGQKSFYDCWLTKHELLKLKSDLLDSIDTEQDRLYIFQLYDNCERQFFGKAKQQSTEPFLWV